MNHHAKKKDATKENTSNIGEPPTLSLEEALLACMPADNNVPAVAGLANTDLDDDTTQANTGFQITAEKENEDVPHTALERSIPHTALERNNPLLQEAILACMPGAYRVSGPFDTTRTTITTTEQDNVDALHTVIEEEEERLSVNAETTVDREREGQQQFAQTSNIVSAYRVTEEEPAIVATPFKDKKVRFLIYGILITAAIALIVGLSVGLTTSSKEAPPSDSLGRLVSSVFVTEDRVRTFLQAKRYVRTENGKEISTWQRDSGCDERKVYEPGCCLGDDCSPRDKCGLWCPSPDVCRPTHDGCRDSSCFECDRGPNGEELYRYRDATFNINCLRTGVAIGFNDKDDTVERIYKWAIVCGVNIEGGNEWENLAPGEYVCAALRSGEGITKTMTPSGPCQLIQLAECGCAPDDVHTLGFPLPRPEKPCRTKQDCRYLCGDAGEEEAKKLCEAFPGIEWWEGENIFHQSLFGDPKEYGFDNVTIEIDIYGE